MCVNAQVFSALTHKIAFFWANFERFYMIKYVKPQELDYARLQLVFFAVIWVAAERRVCKQQLKAVQLINL